MAKRMPMDPKASGAEAAGAAPELPLDRTGGKGPEALQGQPSLLDKVVAQPTSEDPSLEIAPVQEFFIPVHGYVRLTSEEVQVVDHPAVQRLASVQQLGQANLVYRGATHRRIEHALGTLWVAQRMLTEIAGNHRRQQDKTAPATHCALGAPPSAREIAFVRLGALLHDVGHVPCGHTLEDELRILGRHDGVERLQLVLDREQWQGNAGEPLRRLVDRLYAKWAPSGITASDVLIQIVANDPRPTPSALGGIRINVCRDIVGNTVCADILDYLHRDWYHIGKPHPLEERILQYMEIRHDRDDQPQFVISLGDRPKIRTDAVSAILNLLESRYDLAESVLFHRTKCAASAMLERALHELAHSFDSAADRKRWSSELELALADASDETALDFLLKVAADRNPTAARVLSDLRARRLYRGVYTRFREQMAPDISGTLFQLYTETPDAPERRHQAVSLLEYDLGLQEGSLVMYCPHQAMNAKIAKVRIYINGSVDRLDEWERANSNALTGGHLEAQLSRFHRLWRVHFFLARDEAERLQEQGLFLLREAIKKLILKVPSDTPIDDEVRSFAAIAASVRGVPFFGKEPNAALVATRDKRNPTLNYPNGAPSLRAYFEKG